MKFGTNQFSGAAFMISGAFQVLTPLFARQSMVMVIIGMIVIALGYGLYRGMRFLLWIVFLLSAFGVGAALLGVFGHGAWLMWLIAIFNFVTAVSTFWLIWKQP